MAPSTFPSARPAQAAGPGRGPTSPAQCRERNIAGRRSASRRQPCLAKRGPPTDPRATEHSCLATTGRLSCFGIVGIAALAHDDAAGGGGRQCRAYRVRRLPWSIKSAGRPHRVDYDAPAPLTAPLASPTPSEDSQRGLRSLRVLTGVAGKIRVAAAGGRCGDAGVPRVRAVRHAYDRVPRLRDAFTGERRDLPRPKTIAKNHRGTFS